MKKLSFLKSLILCLILLASSQIVKAQAFGEGSKIISAGVKVWNGMTPIYLSSEFYIAENIGIGGSVWYASKTPATGFNTTNIGPGVFGNYHFNLNNDKIDAYSGASLNYWVQSQKAAVLGTTIYDSSFSQVYLNLQSGGRYYFNEKFGINAQVDFNFGDIFTFNHITIAFGASYKF
jgi:outer membrane protein W